MRLSVVLPQQEIGFEASLVRDWVCTLERWGIDEIEAFDHILGGAAEHWADGPPPGFTQVPYTSADAFHEPLTLFAHLAAATTQIGFATSILVLSQRQTVVVAKQCAEIDLLSNGRLRLGVGIGWNKIEHEALGHKFSGRGKRIDEQVDVLRALWTEPVVSFEGQWHHLDRVGINPLPKRPIAIWVGGMSDAAVGRAVRWGEGWALNVDARSTAAAEAPARLARAAEAHGRARESLGISGWIKLPGRTPAEWKEDAELWAERGVDQVGLITRGAGAGPEPHLHLVERFLNESAEPLRRSPSA